ncbi:MAG: hypothetical protein JXR56_09370 [Candidatus Cloacimonetes bacterium]|nr:hypothetical protein [Candidatus Cloacimonadota bacterium]
MKKLVLSFLMIVVLVSGVFCQTFTTASGKAVELSTTPIISSDILNGTGYVIVAILSDENMDGNIILVEVDGVVYRIIK